MCAKENLWQTLEPMLAREAVPWTPVKESSAKVLIYLLAVALLVVVLVHLRSQLFVNEVNKGNFALNVKASGAVALELASVQTTLKQTEEMITLLQNLGVQADTENTNLKKENRKLKHVIEELEQENKELKGNTHEILTRTREGKTHEPGARQGADQGAGRGAIQGDEL